MAHGAMNTIHDGVGGLSTPRGGSISPLARPPPSPKKRSIDRPFKSYQDTPPGPEVTWTQNSAANENGILGISASRGFRKNHHLPCIWWGGKLTIFNAHKNFSAQKFIITD